ncbi:MAG: OsmC family protein [Haloplanus sp.]
MPTRKAEATWNGDLKSGDGSMAFGSGAYEGAYTFASRFEEGEGTNPEELIGAAHAGCFSMALANELDQAGFSPERIDTEASVHLDGGAGEIDRIELTTEGTVPDASEDDFLDIAGEAKENCPVSKALAGVDIELSATLV